MKIIVNDLDGDAVHTVASGNIDDVRSDYPMDHPVRSMIDDLAETGQDQFRKYWYEGQPYTTVVASAE
jgi:hypothetical protein